ncbi:MAG: energy-coupling factor ABC transporter permease [Archaeoglobaceae archaeon]|nr:energy-coupling factor ABC transporter permease [Archaeoglobaceae archaeon]MDW8127658.1 energy-coupling factor ABC transporter permease [Archaeoglobaceae archaeon]
MHIPDGYLDLSIAGTFFVLTVVVLGYSIYRLKGEKLTSLFGVLSAAIFAAQMLNWPIPGGTSAHFVGGSLAGILLGPYAGALAMAIVVTIQTLVFNDGGITAWGANVWNMAIVNVFLGYYIYQLFSRFSRSFSAFIAGWLGITVAAIFVGLEIGLSTSFAYGLTITIPIMGIWHAILGVVEGMITAGVVGYLAVRRADLLEKKEVGKASFALIAGLIALSPVFAYLAEAVGYSEPMENAAEVLGLEEHSLYESIFPDYTIPGLDPYTGTLISGAIGALIVLSLAYAVKYARSSRKDA